MMKGKKFRGGGLVALISALAVIAFAAVVSAETSGIDKGKQMIGPPIEIGKDVGSHKSTGAPVETMTGELSKTTERPMRAPELSEGGLDMRHLLVPDHTDFENALESDRLSAVSF
jgi:hypothetical protein